MVNLQNVNLQNVNLQNANLQNVNLQNINLQNVNLQNVNLQNVNLQNVNLPFIFCSFLCSGWLVKGWPFLLELSNLSTLLYKIWIRGPMLEFFLFVTWKWPKQAKIFFHGKFLKACLMFVVRPEPTWL